MHTINLRKDVVDRVIAKNGREHIYAELEPARTALLVVDLQNAFMMPGVAHALCATSPEIVPNVNRLAAALRETGGTVVWIRTNCTPETRQTWSVYFDMVTPERQAKRVEALTAGSLGHQFWDKLDIRPGDEIVEKTRFSAFIQGSSNLEALLRERGIDTVLITGTVTNVCCESTARDAMMLNFKTVMIADGNAAVTDEDHNAALAAFYLHFGDVFSTDFAIESLRRNAGKRLAAAE